MSAISEIEAWLGTPLFLVPCRTGTKMPVVKYTAETLHSTARPAYQALLEQSNIAVRLGEHSGGLCAIDFDDDQSLNDFLEVNPHLKTSARWKGRRGAQIGVRITGTYPGPCSARHATETVEVNGRQLGRPLYEWRSTGNLSTVRGTHPSGCEYQVLVTNPPVTIAFDQIRWPEGWPVPGENESIARLLEQFGEPWTFNKAGNGTLQAPFFAAYLAHRERILFDTVTGQFYFYLPDRGIWQSMSREEVGQRVLAMARKIILDHAASQNAPHLRGLLVKLTAQFSNQVIDLAAQRQVERSPFQKRAPFVHAGNVMIDLASTPFQTHSFAPEWYSRNQSPLHYAPGAACPQWQAFLDHALPEQEDQLLLQHWGGQALIGRNLAQVILVLQGQGGTGKGTIASLVAAIVGDESIAELRTQHLGGRFEAGLHHGRTLLMGADVPPDFLREGAAARLKAMTGGDRLQVELKHGRDSQTVPGDWNVLITSNTTLRLTLQGDETAWRRRLLIIDFDQPPPSYQTHQYYQVMLDAEGPGILNWFLGGAASLLTSLAQGKGFPMTPRQRSKVESLLGASDSIRRFITQHVRRSSMQSDCVTVQELWAAYSQFCDHNDWTIEPRGRFNRDSKDAMAEIHKVEQTNHVNRSAGDDGERGYRGVTIAGLYE
jgi:P4 family phage/plasmid primase-like protien